MASLPPAKMSEMISYHLHAGNGKLPGYIESVKCIISDYKERIKEIYSKLTR